jgi:non-ribosomal peptide synthetase component F
VLPLDWNGPLDRPFRPFAANDKVRPIAELLQEAVARHPLRVALLDGRTTLTYAQLWCEVERWAQYIADVTLPGESGRHSRANVHSVSGGDVRLSRGGASVRDPCEASS